MARPDGHSKGSGQLSLVDADPPDFIPGQLFEAFAVGISRARWPLDAERHASKVLGHLEANLADGGLESDAQRRPFGQLFAQVVAYAAGRRTVAALSVLRTLAVFAHEEYRAEVSKAAEGLASSGITEPTWAQEIGSPAVERCWTFGDVFGEQESIHAVFAYGRRRHGLAVLVDHGLGGGVKDCWVTDDPDRVWRELRGIAEANPTAVLEPVGWAEARDKLLTATALEPSPVDPDQVDDVATYSYLLAARLALVVDPDFPDSSSGSAPGPVPAARAGSAAKTATKRRPERPREVLQLKVTLKGSKPPIWRRLEVPADIALDRLHDVLLVAFGWHGGHLHDFQVGDRVYGQADPGFGLDHDSEWDVRLSRVAPVGANLLYTYDFGDDWGHTILVEEAHPAQDGVSYPRCTGGRRAAPPEDCGGISAYQELLESAVKSFDPARFNANELTSALANLAL